MRVPNQGKFQSASLKQRQEDWLEISRDPNILQIISGVQIPLRKVPPVRSPTEEELARQSTDPIIDEAVAKLLNLGAVVEVPENSHAFFSRVFTVPKLERGKEYDRRFILNLKVRL